jgi:hypothetical protein
MMKVRKRNKNKKKRVQKTALEAKNRHRMVHQEAGKPATKRKRSKEKKSHLIGLQLI